MDYGFEVGLAGPRHGQPSSIGAAFDDIPLAVYAAMLKAQSEGKEPDFTALMPQMQNIADQRRQLPLRGRLDHQEVLPMAAAMQGMDEKTLLASIGPMVQLSLMQLQNEAFTKQAMEAVTAFLADPKSLTITAKPAAPLKVSDFDDDGPQQAGRGDHQLGVTVTAND